MTDKQSEALSIADWLESMSGQPYPLELRPSAAELRRLHEVNAELVEALREMVEWYAARDADNQMRPALNQHPEIYEAMQALAKATGEQQ